MRSALSFGVVALIALAVVVLPGGGSALDVTITVLTAFVFGVDYVFTRWLFPIFS